MRVTNLMIANKFRKSVQRATEDLAKYQKRVSSGLFAHKPSDDPARANRILSIRTSISKNEQYVFNSDNSEALLDATSSVYDEVAEILMRARELAHHALTDSTNTEDFIFFATETEQLIESVVGSGNAEFAGVYLFAGNETDRTPFVVNRAENVTKTLTAPILEDHDYVTINTNDYNELIAVTPELKGEEVTLTNPDGQSLTGTVLNDPVANPENNVVRIDIELESPDFDLSDNATISVNGNEVGVVSSYVNRDYMDNYILMNIDNVRRARLEADDAILIKDSGQDINATVDKIGEPDGATGEVKVYLRDLAEDTVISSNATVFNSYTEDNDSKILSIDYRGDSGLHSERISKDVYITANTPGDEVYERILDQLLRLRDAFDFGSTDEIDVLYQGLEDSITHIANLQTEVGVKMQRLDTARNRLKDQNVSLSAFLEKVEQVNITDAIVDFQMQENVLNATLASGARVLTPTLFNFI